MGQPGGAKDGVNRQLHWQGDWSWYALSWGTGRGGTSQAAQGLRTLVIWSFAVLVAVPSTW
jgi:hypothetical protein